MDALTELMHARLELRLLLRREARDGRHPDTDTRHCRHDRSYLLTLELEDRDRCLIEVVEGSGARGATDRNGKDECEPEDGSGKSFHRFL